MANFIFGAFVGGFIGILTMALLVAARRNSHDD